MAINEVISLDTTQKVVGTIPAYPSLDGFVDEAGVAARTSTPVWSSSDTACCSVTSDADGVTNVQIVSADLPAGDPPRTAQVKQSFLSGAAVTVELFYDVTVTSLPIIDPPAARLGKPLFGEPEPKA